MALSKEKKSQVVADTAVLLRSSKMTVLAKYPGTSVGAMQQLRTESKASGTQVKVIKNRLFKKALELVDDLKSVDTSQITGQLLYAFSDDDEVAPAQSLANFAKTNPQLSFIGAITAEGDFLPPEDVAVLAALPAKDQLRAQLISTLNAPSASFVNVLAANMRSILNVLRSRAESI